MSDIFISYSRHDQEWVGKFAKALESSGYSIWWDTRLLAGDDFHDVIPAALEEASCVIVVWSKVSVTRKWVKAEAARASDKNVLIPIQIEAVSIPMPFNLLQAENLERWNGKMSDPAFRRLVASIDRFCAKPSLEPISSEPSQLKQRSHATEFMQILAGFLLATSIGLGLYTANTEQSKPSEQTVLEPSSTNSLVTNKTLATPISAEQTIPTKAEPVTPTLPTPPELIPKQPTPAERLQQAEVEFISKDEVDWKNAVEQLQALANEGNVEAWRLLGFAYYKGRGIAPDKKQGCSWYQKAAQAGNAPAKETYAKLCS
jgi:hypothetical protein